MRRTAALLAALAVLGGTTSMGDSGRTRAPKGFGGYSLPQQARATNQDLNVFATIDTTPGFPTIAFRSSGNNSPPVGTTFGEAPAGVDWIVAAIVLYQDGVVPAVTGTGFLEVALFVGSGQSQEAVQVAYRVSALGFVDVLQLPYPVRIPSQTPFRVVAGEEGPGDVMPLPNAFWGVRLLGYWVPATLPLSLLLLQEDPSQAAH